MEGTNSLQDHDIIMKHLTMALCIMEANDEEAEAAAIPIAIDFFSGGAVLPIIATIVDIPPAPRPIPVIKPKLKIIKLLDGLLKI